MTENTYETLVVTDLAEGVVLCTFNRPKVRNALDITMVEDVRRLLVDLTLRDDVRALVFTGAGGKAFISGADIAQLKERGKFDALRRINSALFREIEQFQWPTIAAIDGYALGGGANSRWPAISGLPAAHRSSDNLKFHWVLSLVPVQLTVCHGSLDREWPEN